MVYGYCRISTKKQNIERQKRNILEVDPTAKLYCEAFTGKVIARPQFEKMLHSVKPGDTIIFDSVSRMSRNAEEGFSLYKRLYNDGISLVFINEPQINTATYKDAAAGLKLGTVSTGDADSDDLVNGIFAKINEYVMKLAERQIRLAFIQSEKEVSDLSTRTKGGLKTARLEGKQIGQRAGKKLNVKKAEPSKKAILKYSKDFYGTLSDGDCIKLIGISRNTYYKYKNELRNDATVGSGV